MEQRLHGFVDGLIELVGEGLADQPVCHQVGHGGIQGDQRLAEIASALSESEARFRVLTDAMPQMVWSTRPDGYHDFYNARWYEFTGVPVGSSDGDEWNDLFADVRAMEAAALEQMAENQT